MALAVPIKVNVGTKTSSLFLIPQAFMVKCNAAVPFTTAIAYLDPVNFFNLSSNFFIKPPTDET